MRLRACIGIAASLACLGAAAGELSVRGNVALEAARYPAYRGTAPDPVENPQQERSNLAFKGQLDLAYTASDKVSYGLRAFGRRDAANDQRDTLRLDEAWAQYAAERWDLRVGNQVVTWGSVESVSPLDIVNPRDYEEDLVDPRKIGVPAARARWRFGSGDFSVFWLPYYKPSIVPGQKSYYSLGGGLRQQDPDSRWDASQFAARWFHSGSGYDVGVSYVHGRERDPSFEFDPATTSLVGRAPKSRRLGIDVTKVFGDLIVKGELVHRHVDRPSGRNSLLYVLGVEYTLSPFWEHSELTFFAEYLGASRNVRRSELFGNDLFLAVRWTLNDRYRQRLQVGTMRDLDRGSAHVLRVEYSGSPVDNVDVGVTWTDTRNFFPGPRHVESDDGAWQIFVRYNF